MKVNQSQHKKVLHEPKSPSFGGVRGGSGPKGPRGDPPIESRSRGQPSWIGDRWDDPPKQNADPLPKGNGKGYSPEMNDCTLQK